MAIIKRIPVDELTQLVTDLAYEELVTSTTRWENDNRTDVGKTLFRMDLEEELTNCAIFRDRIDNFMDRSVDKSLTKDQRSIYSKAVELLYKLNDDTELTTVAYSKALYKKEKNIYNSRFYLEFPLSKKIGTLYDDLSAFLLRYCDISAVWNNKQTLIRSYQENERALEHFAEMAWVNNEKRQTEFLNLSTDDERCAYLQEEFGEDYIDMFEKMSIEDRRTFVREHVEFTHCALGPVDSALWGIILYGEIDNRYKEGNGEDISALPKEYADFENLTLEKTMSIANNDLQQFLQSKIDIDKENLKVVDEKNVRGDIYKVLEAPESFDNGRFKYFIRYVCPSTQRVYYNVLDERSLSESRFYKKGKVDSYIYAWWHINNCGEDPMAQEEVIRC